MGIWRSHHSVGNMLGSLIASSFVEYNWGLSFVVPSAIIVALAVVLFLFLVPEPEDVGCLRPDHSPSSKINETTDFQMTATELTELAEVDLTSSVQTKTAISFLDALKIPVRKLIGIY